MIYKFTNDDGAYVLVEEDNTTKACLKLEAGYCLEYRLEYDQDMLDEQSLRYPARRRLPGCR